jgi:hypothetical protein
MMARSFGKAHILRRLCLDRRDLLLCRAQRKAALAEKNRSGNRNRQRAQGRGAVRAFA